MRAFGITLPARLDLAENWDYIAADDVTLVDRLESDFYSAKVKLAQKRFLGPRRSDHTAHYVWFFSVRKRYLHAFSEIPAFGNPPRRPHPCDLARLLP